MSGGISKVPSQPVPISWKTGRNDAIDAGGSAFSSHIADIQTQQINNLIGIKLYV